ANELGGTEAVVLPMPALRAFLDVPSQRALAQNFTFAVCARSDGKMLQQELVWKHAAHLELHVVPGARGEQDGLVELPPGTPLMEMALVRAEFAMTEMRFEIFRVRRERVVDRWEVQRHVVDAI